MNIATTYRCPCGYNYFITFIDGMTDDAACPLCNALPDTDALDLLLLDAEHEARAAAEEDAADRARENEYFNNL